MDRVPSIGRGQILTSEDAPARIDAGIELDLGLGGSEKRRSWPEEPDPVHNKAGVHRSQPGDGSRAPGELYSSIYPNETAYIHCTTHQAGHQPKVLQEEVLAQGSGIGCATWLACIAAKSVTAAARLVSILTFPVRSQVAV